jgi:hypothetical protein
MADKDKAKQFRQDLLNTVNTRGKGDVADAIGMPDDQDYDTLVRIFRRYEKKFPGRLRHTLEEARQEFISGTYGTRLMTDHKALVNKESNMTYELELPEELYRAIEQVFPSMFVSKKHFGWFKKKFAQLTIAAVK